MDDNLLKESLKLTLKRLAWRLQYYERRRITNEKPLVEEVLGTTEQINEKLSDIYIQEVLESLPNRARFIIQNIVIHGLTEKEVALKLNISRQGVSKCKNKYLKKLKMEMEMESFDPSWKRQELEITKR
ncbi:sigma factor-like helix-turn-helix DNA-binding protein [Bacillus sp. FJAT-27445]|uniref:sigma factor-like helix-turn-helix DNA-binding protein n=1 Tax=Bacillus sp. FJAT-27445 TaxID=1679166 RepID=UPI00074334E7|nr:sigma factor-like helix-turn-helix DNA-binding protein [Bacillus sp. FJAT-27445]